MSKDEMRVSTRDDGAQAFGAQSQIWLGHVLFVLGLATLVVGLDVRGEGARASAIAGWVFAVVGAFANVLLQFFRVDGRDGPRRHLVPFGVMFVSLLCLASAQLVSAKTVSIVLGVVGTAMSLLAYGWFIVLVSRSEARRRRGKRESVPVRGNTE